MYKSVCRLHWRCFVAPYGEQQPLLFWDAYFQVSVCEVALAVKFWNASKLKKESSKKKTDKNKFRWRVFRHFLKRNKNFNNISAAQSAKQQPTWNNQILGFAENSAVSHILVYVVIQSYAWRWLDMFRLAQKIYRTNLILTHVS